MRFDGRKCSWIERESINYGLLAGFRWGKGLPLSRPNPGISVHWSAQNEVKTLKVPSSLLR